jgi:hypothetical protein
MGNMHVGDFIQACAIITSGNNYAKVFLMNGFTNMGTVNKSTFLRIQRNFCIPAIEDLWDRTRESILVKFKEKELVLIGKY